MPLSVMQLFDLLEPGSVALTVFVVSVVAVLGLGLGSLKLRGLTLGIGGVLFAGLAIGQGLSWMSEGLPPKASPTTQSDRSRTSIPTTASTTQATAADHGVTKPQPKVEALDKHVMEFAREFGLILFVYTIGVQVGPGFFASLRKQGLPLNLMAASIVALGAILTIIVCKVGGVDMKDAIGIFSGAVTNTPSLAAAQQAMGDSKGIHGYSGTVAGYAIAYPFGILGIILAMVLIRVLFKINIKSESAQFEAQMAEQKTSLATMTIEVTNPNLAGREIRKIPAYDDGDVVISRVLKQGKLEVANPQMKLALGDVVLAVGPKEALDDLRVVLGKESDLDLRKMPSQITTRRVLVTKNEVLGQSIDELNLVGRMGVSITRIRRGDVELPPAPTIPLQFGDVVLAVGEEAAIGKAAAMLGDSTKRLNHPQVIPIFVGLALGVLLGSIKVQLWGMPAAVKLGLAGGPLVVAIILSRLGHFGPLVWHLPQSANFALRELGIVMFLAAVGLKSGGEFFQVLFNGPGLVWMAWGAMITVVPLLIVGIFAQRVMKTNYLSTCGLLAGSMTDPPALAFAGTVTGSEAPGIAYASVYPLVMLLRVIVAQALVLAFVAAG